MRNLYQPGTKNVLYWYCAGVNPRAIIALLVGITPLLPGLANSINENVSVPKGAVEFYTMSWLDGCILSGLTYYLLFLAFPWQTHTDENGQSPVLEGSNVDEENDVGTPVSANEEERKEKG